MSTPDVMTFQRRSPSDEATHALGAGIAHLLRPGDVLAISGPLGAGKTALIRGIALALGVPASSVSSPTFVIANVYAIPAPRIPAITSFIHVDAYRITDPSELENVGWDRLFSASGEALGAAVAAIEWPERIPQAISPAAPRLTLEHVDASTRLITVQVPPQWSLRPDFDLLSQRPPIQCPVTRRWVAPTARTYPFFDERAQAADLYRWIVPTEPDDPDDSDQ